jgi:hypothetical protein
MFPGSRAWPVHGLTTSPPPVSRLSRQFGSYHNFIGLYFSCCSRNTHLSAKVGTKILGLTAAARSDVACGLKATELFFLFSIYLL